MTIVFSNNSTSVRHSKQISPIVNNHQPLKIIALGDSLIYGFGDFVGGGWVERLRRQWMSPQGAGHVLYNLGVRGDRVSQVSQRLEQEFNRRGELRNRVPDLILLSVGVNDSARLGKPDGKLHTNLAEFKQEIANLLDLTQRLGPVLFIGMTPVNEAQMPFVDCFYYNHFDQYRYKEVTAQACHQRDIPYLDIFDLWASRGEDWVRSHLSDDGLHPNVIGYEILLKDILSWRYMSRLHPSLENAAHS